MYLVFYGVGGEVFCWFFYNRYLLFVMGKVFIFFIVCLVIEWWFCVFKFMKYEKDFSRKRVLIYVVVMFIVMCIFFMNKFFEVRFFGEKCVIKNVLYGKDGMWVFIILYSVVIFYILCFLMWFIFVDIILNFFVIFKESVNEIECKI